MPAGVLLTAPLPVPALLTVRLKGATSNVAVTVIAEVMVTVHGSMPTQLSPLQPVKVKPLDGVAVRVTEVPLGNVPEQLDPQLMPSGVLMTVPLPAPVFTTARPNI